MPHLLRRLWDDDRGAIISVELLLLLGVLVFGLIPGFVALRNSIIASFGTLGNILMTTLPSFTYSGYAIGPRFYYGHTVAQVQGYAVWPNSYYLLTGYQTIPYYLGTYVVIPPAP